MTLGAFLARTAGEPFQWGANDCCLWAGAWIREATGLDPLAAYRGRYQTRLGAMRFVRRAGGMAAIVGTEMQAVGLPVVDAPRPGDVGVVADGHEEAVAIRVDHGWAARTERGMIVMPFRSVIVWGIPCRL